MMSTIENALHDNIHVSEVEKMCPLCCMYSIDRAQGTRTTIERWKIRFLTHNIYAKHFSMRIPTYLNICFHPTLHVTVKHVLHTKGDGWIGTVRRLVRDEFDRILCEKMELFWIFDDLNIVKHVPLLSK